MRNILIFILPIFLIGQDSKIPSDIQTVLNQAKDYYDVSLFDESKWILLKLLHSDKGRQ